MNITEIQLLISILPLAYVGGAVIPILIADVREARVPNKIVYPMMLLTLLCWLTLAIWQGAWFNLGMAILFFIVGILLGSFLNIKFDALGMGDVKLIATFMMMLGWFSWQVALLFMPVIALSALLYGFFYIMLSKNVSVIRLAPVVFVVFGFSLAVVLN